MCYYRFHNNDRHMVCHMDKQIDEWASIQMIT